MQKFILNPRTLVLFLGYMSNDEEVCQGDWPPLGQAQSGFRYMVGNTTLFNSTRSY